MKIHCDHCGTEITKEDARVITLDDQTLYFCSTECLEKKGYHETMRDPGPEQGEDPR